jgi:hypothetical protein
LEDNLFVYLRALYWHSPRNFEQITIKPRIQTVHLAITRSQLYRYSSLLGTNTGKVRHNACIFTGQRRRHSYHISGPVSPHGQRGRTAIQTEASTTNWPTVTQGSTRTDAVLRHQTQDTSHVLCPFCYEFGSLRVSQGRDNKWASQTFIARNGVCPLSENPVCTFISHYRGCDAVTNTNFIIRSAKIVPRVN